MQDRIFFNLGLRCGLALPRSTGLTGHQNKGADMGIDSESEIEANLQIGPTSLGMVRIFVEGNGIEIPMEFEPDEAIAIADEIRAAAERARAASIKSKKR